MTSICCVDRNSIGCDELAAKSRSPMILILLLILFFCGWCIVYFGQSLKPPTIQGPVLIVTAHPDDECMFFSPVILSLLKWNIPVDLLCLSSGNYYGDGHLRCDELRRAVVILGIRHHMLICDTKLPDSPRKIWAAEHVQKYISKAVRKWHSKTIISFDVFGVSGHSNHCQIHSALAELPLGVSDVFVYCLKTYDSLLKYCTPLIVLLALCLERRYVFHVPFSGTLTPHKAMLQHRSQLLWFRYLYMIFSSYMYINVLSPLKSR
ncbi:N acetylglucosaminyl phosphatidylinositol [Echinococcus multilocularis]|uniref:N-acetylglucosaminylphosphatidylinositol deacetylase n=1 Tax=Echinococcus multilocularis TaxID=6211 RepID=A0A087W220_ECHMU|nr:N acetylglucosaminyl phosphatidylinositol [Echinococcus multilocularis]